MPKPTNAEIQTTRDVLGWLANNLLESAKERVSAGDYNTIQRTLGLLPNVPAPALPPDLVEKADPDSILGLMSLLREDIDRLVENRSATGGSRDLTEEEKRRCQKITAPGKDH